MLALAVKKISAMLMDSPDVVERAVLLNEEIQQIVCDELVQSQVPMQFPTVGV